MEKMANDWTPEELQRQYPHLTVSQIYAALAYYFGHQSEMDAEIEQNVRDADRMQAEAGESALAKRLREAGKLK